MIRTGPGKTGGILALLFVLSVSVFAAGTDKPILIDRPEVPPLPRVLKNSSVSGITLFRAKISQSGMVDEVAVIRSSGMEALDGFLSDWIRKWKFLPRVDNYDIQSSYTVITIRFDLANQLFKAPDVIRSAVAIPDSVAERISGNSSAMEKKAYAQPALKVSEIPLDIQKLSLSGKCELVLTLDKDSRVSAVSFRHAPDSKRFLDWLKAKVLGTHWVLPEISGSSNAVMRLLVPVKFNTGLCRISFSGGEIYPKNQGASATSVEN